ncbi:MAG TPA: hypothetical protein VGM90_28820 [Kofleriaceae bacterium]|jgi:hypothetical protein
MVVRSRVKERIEARFPESTSARQVRELGAFARYCAHRVERDLGQYDAWIIDIAPALGGYVTHVAVCDRGAMVEEQGSGHDGALAVWDAMCRVEQRLREPHR